MLGGLGNVRALFECEDVPIQMRFVWSDIGESSARWEQSFSFDGGRSWKANWIMELTREP
jgi:hypothetical protein